MAHAVAFYVDGGKGIGLGHAARGLGLAHAFKQRGFAPVFLIPADDILKAFLGANRYEMLAGANTSESILAAQERMGAGILVVDSYRLNSQELAKLNARVPLLVCFDDQAERELPVDILVNGSPAATDLPYRTRPDTKRLLGLSYQVVRPEFIPPSGKSYDDPPNRLLVTIGGDDLLGLLPKLLAFLGEVCNREMPACGTDVIVGSYIDGLESCELPSNIELHRNPQNVRALMQRADMAISGGGQTLFELARCGTPTIAFCLGEDQWPTLMALERLGAIDYLGWMGQVGWLKRLHRSLRRMAADRVYRERLGRTASSLVDGSGAHRTVKVVEALVS